MATLAVKQGPTWVDNREITAWERMEDRQHRKATSCKGSRALTIIWGYYDQGKIHETAQISNDFESGEVEKHRCSFSKGEDMKE